jgi:hypothetical protein
MTTTDTTETTRHHMEATVAYATEQLQRDNLSSFSREHYEVQVQRANAWLKRNPAWKQADARLAQCQVEIQKWTDLRDRLIREARDAGRSLREIGDEAGISHTAVAKILAR